MLSRSWKKAKTESLSQFRGVGGDVVVTCTVEAWMGFLPAHIESLVEKTGEI